MLKGSNKTILFLVFFLLLLGPKKSLAWHDHYYNYYGSGRDHAYSQYVNLYYSPEYISLSSFDPRAAAFIHYINYPGPPILTPASNPYTSTIPIYSIPSNLITVNIPNHWGGGYTSVVLKRSGKGYVGPQGEYYTEFPTVAELETRY